MDQDELELALSGLPLGPIRYFDSASSTNELARQWAEEGGPDLALVVADEQTAGKGRSGRSWLTPAGMALAFSLVLRPGEGAKDGNRMPLLGGGAGLAVATALNSLFSLQVKIKWPNDVLIKGEKVCGILTEADWRGDQLRSMVLGIGVNAFKESVPPAHSLRYPATSIETVLGRKPDRIAILAKILQAFLVWHVKTPGEVVAAWDAVLAYKNQLVRIEPQEGRPYEGRVHGLDQNGYLLIELPSGEIARLTSADLSLRLVDSLAE